MRCFVDVILPLSLPYTYTYSVPEYYLSELAIGKRAVVQFGSKKFYSAVIVRVHDTPPTNYTAKAVEYLLDEEACVSDHQIKFWYWMADYYMSKIGDLMNAALPAGLKIESISAIQMNADYSIDVKMYEQLNEMEKRVLDILAHQKRIRINELEKVISKSSIPKLIKNLADKEVIIFSEELEERYQPKLCAYVELNPKYKNKTELAHLVTHLEKRAFKQLEGLLAYLNLSQKDALVKKSLLIEKSSASSIKALIDKNVLIEQVIEESRLSSEETERKKTELSDIQKEKIREIQKQWESKQACVLYGEVGSGKTEIYIEWIKEQLVQQKQVLYLVPEIALTVQLIQRLKKVFGNQVYVYHSKFSENERTEIWNKLLKYDMEKDHPKYKDSAARIVLGPRSAMFLPFKYLGLIIVDEEHDSSFQQRQKHPYYNARDAAIYLASMTNAKILLGSATPSVETMFNCDIGKYGKVVLKEKYGKASVYRKLIDLRKYYHQMQGQHLISPPLFESIKDRLNKKEQVLIFHNRRGYVPVIQCTTCGWVAKCKNCDVSMVYHKQHHVLNCHYCGEIGDLMTQCPACGSVYLNYKGWGTEKVEEEFLRMFSNYSIARLDQDTTRSKLAHKNIIEAFENQEIDILIGTQMITKGLDFKNVTLVGVLNADSILHFPDFRSFERAFQLLYQLSGRSGRMEKDGEVLVQTFHPDHPILQMYLENDYDKMYQHVLKERRTYNYPPYTKLCELIIKSKDVTESAKGAQQLYLSLYPYFKEYILGPIQPYISKLNNFYLHQILIKIPKHYSNKKSKSIIRQNAQKVQNSKVIVDIIIDS